jgi:hypothetical protein
VQRAFPDDDWRNVLRSQDLERWVHRVIATADLSGDATVDAGDRRLLQQLIGDESADTVLVKPVSVLALYNERQLASGLLAEIDRRTGCIYAYNGDDVPDPPPDPFRPSFPALVAGANVTDIRINRWIEGDTDGDGFSFGPNDRPTARLFTIDRFSGRVKPMILEPGAGGNP